ncbi:hypothetical protein O9G_000617 [Rozella allomycis CSF55]|uniref:PIH1D1/2/3 CS-like domain-containing protein n=1 Tax=Rozella allomycis (strain CSF55) TaxID=988480 RepID=A0A075AVZ0_ROZAC|nr:hypothetical protein O9G_000617 [Rozella allomycis CSF55]|eukprot:EPZ34430.1 hypothetical protein O9G_000617 [Rozella allomycis CSF55]
MLVDISIDSANKNFDLGLDKGNIYKSIIKEPSKDIQDRKEETSIEYVEKMIGEKKQKELVTPKYTIIHRGEFDYSEYAYYSNNESRARKPKYLVLKIELPGLVNMFT